MSTIKRLFPAFLLLLLSGLIASTGCSDPESSARKLYNDAINAQKEGREQDAFALYEGIVEKYPETQTAVEANRLLLQRSLMQEKEIRAALDLFRLDNFRYPSTEEGLTMLVEPSPQFSHWKGPYLDGPTAKSLEAFSYALVGNDIELARRPRGKR